MDRWEPFSDDEISIIEIVLFHAETTGPQAEVDDLWAEAYEECVRRGILDRETKT